MSPSEACPSYTHTSWVMTIWVSSTFGWFSQNTEMANCAIHHQNEARHTKGSRGHSPTFHLFNLLSLACNFHPASQERYVAINMTERTFRRSRERFIFFFWPRYLKPMTSETLGAVVQSTAFPSTDPTAIYCLFPSRLYILLCEMVNPQSVIISQTGYTYYIYIQLHNTYTFNTHTHTTFPLPQFCFHSQQKLHPQRNAREPMMRTWPCAVAFWSWWIPCHRCRTRDASP